MIEATVAALLTAVVLVCCAAIYDLRWHVREMIGVAALLVILLGSVALIMAVVEAPTVGDDAMALIAAREAR